MTKFEVICSSTDRQMRTKIPAIKIIGIYLIKILSLLSMTLILNLIS